MTYMFINAKARMYFKAKELVRKCYVLQPYNHWKKIESLSMHIQLAGPARKKGE